MIDGITRPQPQHTDARARSALLCNRRRRERTKQDMDEQGAARAESGTQWTSMRTEAGLETTATATPAATAVATAVSAPSAPSAGHDGPPADHDDLGGGDGGVVGTDAERPE